MRSAMIALAAALVFAPPAPPAGAAATGVQLAQSKDDAMRRELQRLQDDRQRLLDKAAQSRMRREQRTRKGAAKTSQPHPRLTLVLPPGWSSGEAAMALEKAAIGDTPAFAKVRSEFTVYAAEESPETIIVERFGGSQSLSPDDVYRRWRKKVNAGCADGRETGPDDSDRDGQAVIDSFYTCFKRKADDRAEVSMLKVIEGPAELFVVSRLWMGPSPVAGEDSGIEAMIDEWRTWSASAAKVEDGGGKHRKKLSQGYGFVVSNDGHLLTADHLVRDCSSVSFSSFPAKLVASDPDKDLALFKFEAKPESVAVAVAVFRTGLEAAQGDIVALQGFETDAAAGVISALIGPGGDPRLLSVSVPISAANGGLPLVDLGGIVAGMAMDRANAMKISASPPGVPAAANFALSAKVLKGFLDAQRVVYETSNAGTIFSPGVAAQRARSTTALVECWN
ncbi:MAG: serine protease [Proteobacteria bacterium]|nr:serine protease [Pseudomonadota bacterium]